MSTSTPNDTEEKSSITSRLEADTENGKDNIS